MRFIFDYVTCCMMSSPCNNEAPSSHPPSARATEDETRSLVTTAPAMSGRRRKRTPTRGSSADWQPSLFAIAEDNNATAATKGKTAEKVNRPTVATAKPPSAQRNVKRCGASSGRVGSSSRSYDFSRDPLPMVIPTFSAAPFMF